MKSVIHTYLQQYIDDISEVIVNVWHVARESVDDPSDWRRGEEIQRRLQDAFDEGLVQSTSRFNPGTDEDESHDAARRELSREKAAVYADDDNMDEIVSLALPQIWIWKHSHQRLVGGTQKYLLL